MDKRVIDNRGWRLGNEISLADTGQGPSGRNYYCFEHLERNQWFDEALFHPDPHLAWRSFARAKFRVITPAQRAAVLAQIEDVSLFPPTRIVEGVGWGPNWFGYPDGTIFSPTDEPLPLAYHAGTVCVRTQGSFEDWESNVATFVQTEPVALFCLLIALAAPMLRFSPIQGNFGFMLSGRGGKGKTTLLNLAGSTCGPVLDSSYGRFYLKFNNTMNRLEEWLPHYNDLPYIVDELSSHGTRTSRLNEFRTLVHYLAGVDVKGRKGDQLAPAVQVRTIFLISSNDYISDLLSREDENAAEAAAERLFELRVPEAEEGYWICHKGRGIAQQFSEQLNERVGRYYGSAMRAQIQALVTSLTQSDRFKGVLNRLIAEFAELPAVRELGTVSPRALRAFGLVYAAGRYARDHGILPDESDSDAAVLHCLRLHLGTSARSGPLEQIMRFVRSAKLVDLRGGKRVVLNPEEIESQGLFIGECRGEPQLWIHPKLFRKTFPDPLRLLRRLQRRNLLKPDGKGADGNLMPKCPVGAGKLSRMHVIKVPNFEQWLDANGYPNPNGRDKEKRIMKKA